MQNTKQLNTMIHLSDITEIAIGDDVNYLPEQFVVDAENRKIVVQAIDRLPQRQREAVLLYYYNRLDVTETAEVMGISQPTASIYLKEACTRIKRDIESSAGKLINAIQGLVVIPFGDMLSRTLYTESAAFTPTTQTWMADTIAKCGDIAVAGAVAVGGVVRGVAGAAAGVETGVETGAAAAPGTAAASGMTATIISVAKKLLAILAATVAILAITTSVILWHSGQDTRAYIYAVGDVIYTSEHEKSHINPTSATAVSDSRYGELYVNNWDIVKADCKTVLFSGDSNMVDESIFTAMRENGHFGDFELIFIMEDAYGAIYELAHNFFLYE